MIELVVTDLDGSLWHREEIHPATRAAWSELERRGIPVIVATGRRLSTTREPLARAGLAPAAVILNGALAVELATGECFHRRHYETADATKVLNAFRLSGLDPCVYVEHSDIDIYVGSQPSTNPGHLASFGSRAVCANLDEIVATVPVLSFGIIGHEPEPLAHAVSAIGIGAEVHLDADSLWGGDTLTVAPLGLSKWAGVLAYCDRAGIDSGRVLAVGDGPNDRELLTRAAVAVVPTSGFEQAVKAADHLVGPPSEGGWAEILDFV